MTSTHLNNLLSKHRVDGVVWTHVSMFNPKGKYQIDRRTMESFWRSYQDSVKKSDKMSIAEKPQQYLPVLVDVDLKHLIPSNNSEDNYEDYSDNIDNNTDILFYTDEHITETISCYQSVLRNILDDCTDDDLLCVVLEKSPYTIKKGINTYIKNGFHLHFPNIFLKKADHEVQLLPRVKAVIQDSQIFDDLGFSDIDKVIDSSYTKVPWLLYGSSKETSFDSYIATKVIDANGDCLSIDDALADYKIFDEKEKEIDITGKVTYYLPRILSIIPFGREIKEIKQDLSYPLINQCKTLKNSDKKQYVRESIEAELKHASDLINMIDDSRAESYNDWMTIGWTLFNISDGTMEGLDLWLDFSKRCGEKYDESGCRFEWSKMIKKDITIGTLRYFAKQDNPKAYNEFISKLVSPHIDKSLYGSHNDIAKALYEQYRDKYVCSSIMYKEWWEFENNVWKRMDDGIGLRSKISDEIVHHYETMGQEMFKKLATCAEHEKALYNEKLTRAQKLINNLKSAPFKNNVMKEAMEVFYNGHFLEKLDANPWIVGFRNGVYDVKQHIFRIGHPDDYISKQLGVDYDASMTEQDSRVADVHDFLEKIFPDKSVRDYFMDHSSDVFIGGNPQKLVAVWSGEGDNGKSVTQSLFEKMLELTLLNFPQVLSLVNVLKHLQLVLNWSALVMVYVGQFYRNLTKLTPSISVS